MKHLLLITLLFCSAWANAQLSVSVNSTNSQFFVPAYFSIDPPFEVRTTGFGIGYIQRLKERRIDFFPSLEFQYKKEAITSAFNRDLVLGKISEKVSTLNFQLRVFPFDFRGINRPHLIRKNNRMLKRDLYLFLQSGLTLIQQKYTLVTTAPTRISRSFTDVEIKKGLGIGFELGLSQRISLNFSFAIFNFNNYPNDFLQALESDCPIPCFHQDIVSITGKNDFHDVMQNQFGLTLIWNLGKNEKQH